MRKENRKQGLFLTLGLVVLAGVALGEATADLTAPADPGFLVWLHNLAGQIPASGVMVTVGAIVVEFLCRIIKTQKPLSILYVVRNGFIYAALAFNAIAKLLDSVYQASNESVNPLPQALNTVPIKQDEMPQPMAKL